VTWSSPTRPGGRTRRRRPAASGITSSADSFYAWTPDITQADFSQPVEIDTVEATGGHITNLDLWIDPRGTAHLLYLKTNLSSLLRDEFFPGQVLVTTLEYVQVVGGKVTQRTSLRLGGEKARETPHYGRFHVTEDGALWVVELVTGTRPDGSPLYQNRVFAIRPGQDKITSIPLPLKTPFSTFFTAAVRGGNRPSNVLDLFGLGADGETLRYARVRMP
jgi:hypothetical protein